MNNMEEKYLYPAFPIMHIGLGDGYIEYMLSSVLGSWGYVIRHINRNLSVLAYIGGNGKRSGSIQLQLAPSDEYLVQCPSLVRIDDLKLRYHVDADGNLESPVVVRAYVFCG